MLFNLLAFAVGLLILWILFKILSFPIKILMKLLVNALIGAVILVLFNFFGAIIGIALPITLFTSFLTGVLGIGGVIIILVFTLLF